MVGKYIYQSHGSYGEGMFFWGEGYEGDREFRLRTLPSLTLTAKAPEKWMVGILSRFLFGARHGSSPIFRGRTFRFSEGIYSNNSWYTS